LNQDVGRLQVAMNNPLSVRMVQPVANVAEDLDQRGQPKTSASEQLL
jgi:hypothetical protein